MKTIDMRATLFNGYAKVNADPKRWPTYDGQFLDRRKYVTSSEIGKCARMIKFSKSVDAAPLDKWGFAERGHTVEAWAANLIRLGTGGGYSVMNTGDKQVSFYDGVQSGTPDGIVRRPDGDYEVLEIKSIDPRTSLKNLPKPDQITQIQQNIDLVSACWKVRVVGSHLLHINASDFQSIKYEFYPADHKIQAGLEERANMIMSAKSPDDLPPEGMFVERGCQYCGFTEQCSSMVAKTKKEGDKMKELEGITNNVFR